MCSKDTVRFGPLWVAAFGLASGVLCTQVCAQAPAQNEPAAGTSWRQIGNGVIDRGLAGPAGGPLNRVWYSNDGNTIFVQTTEGLRYRTDDLETWQSVDDRPPEPTLEPIVSTFPEINAHTRAVFGETGRLYGFGRFVYSSRDGGRHWDNLTFATRNAESPNLVGRNLTDMAISPANGSEITVTGADGVFRSVDGGATWTSLNDGLPNLPVARLLSVPQNGQGARISLAGQLDTRSAVWEPGQKTAWSLSADRILETEGQWRAVLASRFTSPISAIALNGQNIYIGLADGTISVSTDGGLTWADSAVGQAVRGHVQKFWVDSEDPRIALAAVFSELPGMRALKILHTVNAGTFWDDLTSNLPGNTYGVAANRASAAIYAATTDGVFQANYDLATLASGATWERVTSLVSGKVVDVMLDPQANQLWAAVEGQGVFATLAPHRLRDPKVVSAADLIARSFAPGSVVSLLGPKVDFVRVGGLSAAVLAGASTSSEVQIPFEAPLGKLPVSTTPGLPLSDITLLKTAPAIFVAQDGSPMLLDGDTGVLLDPANGAHSGGRLQILATGLGRVKPEWPSGVPAPLLQPPAVEAAVSAYLDHQLVEVVSATLAPGYVGLYLIEVNVPKVVNAGPAQLYLEVGGVQSNAVRVYIEP